MSNDLTAQSSELPAGEPVSSETAGLRNCVIVWLAGLVAFALVLNREGTTVPGGNEQIYFLYLYKAWHHAFLNNDWTVGGEPTAGHAVFNFLFGWPTRFIALETWGWIGRFGSWIMLFWAMLRIGRHFRLPVWLVGSGILLWLIQRQSFVANEWIIGTFEAKCLGYICLLWAIDFILRGWIIVPAILTGLAFSFHSAVGLWGGAAIGLAFAVQNPLRQTLKFALIAALFALPGVITSFNLVAGGHSITPEQARYLVTIEMPFHLDPFRFGTGKIVVLYLMLLFNCLHFWANRRDDKLRFIVAFEVFAGLFFALGVGLRCLNQFTLVQLFPFRVFAVVIMLMFFWHLGAMYWNRRENRPGPILVAVGIFTFLCLPSAVMRLQGLVAYDLPKWRHRQPDEFRQAATWICQHTPENAVVIAPPWRKDAFYFTKRALIACWHAPRFNAMTQWRERIESLVDDLSKMDPEDNLAGDMDERARAFYFSLSPAAIASIQTKYGGDLLLTTSKYTYPLLYQTGNRESDYKVYRLSH